MLGSADAGRPTARGPQQLPVGSPGLTAFTVCSFAPPLTPAGVPRVGALRLLPFLRRPSRQGKTPRPVPTIARRRSQAARHYAL